jgi:formylglycine-generating enzyme
MNFRLGINIFIAIFFIILGGVAHSADIIPTYENSAGMSFILVPAGEFLMGSEETPESLAIDYPNYPRHRFVELQDEAPVHAVRISRSFYLGKYEVTIGQFKQFVESSGYVPESEADGTGGYGYNVKYDPSQTVRQDAFEGRDRKYSWKNPGFPQADDHPVVNVTWNDAVAMAQWLSQNEKRHYRLPTEAEWEYACRAGAATRYYNGNSPSGLNRIANTFDQTVVPFWVQWKDFATEGSDNYAFTAPVGQFLPNAFGLYDMLGNVWEWVSDWYGKNYYAESPTVDPTGPQSGGVKVRRGGSWHTWPLYVRCSFRNWNTTDTRYTLVGIRLLLETESTGAK